VDREIKKRKLISFIGGRGMAQIVMGFLVIWGNHTKMLMYILGGGYSVEKRLLTTALKE
jgi:hypothetical protein